MSEFGHKSSLMASQTFYTLRGICRSDGLQGHALLLMTRLPKRPSLSRFRVTSSSPSYTTHILILFSTRPVTVRLYNPVTTSLGHGSRKLPRATKDTLECPSRSYRRGFYANKNDGQIILQKAVLIINSRNKVPRINTEDIPIRKNKSPIACQHHACNSYKFQIYPLPRLFPLMLAALAVGIRMQYAVNKTRGKAGKHG